LKWFKNHLEGVQLCTAVYMEVLFNVNSSEYLLKITNTYHEEEVAKFLVIVAGFIFRKFMCVFEVFWMILIQKLFVELY
jgi:hypothetical protein